MICRYIFTDGYNLFSSDCISKEKKKISNGKLEKQEFIQKNQNKHVRYSIKVLITRKDYFKCDTLAKCHTRTTEKGS